MSHDITCDGKPSTLNLYVRSDSIQSSCSLSSVGSAAPVLQAGGHWFKSNREHNNYYLYSMEKNEMKKGLMKTKVMAVFSHYCAGNLYYKFWTAEGTYQFPIATVEYASKTDAEGDFQVDMNLSSDLGTTAFNAEEKASMLWRWIDKAIDAGELQKMNDIPPSPEPPKDRIIREGKDPRHP